MAATSSLRAKTTVRVGLSQTDKCPWRNGFERDHHGNIIRYIHCQQSQPVSRWLVAFSLPHADRFMVWKSAESPPVDFVVTLRVKTAHFSHVTKRRPVTVQPSPARSWRPPYPYPTHCSADSPPHTSHSILFADRSAQSDCAVARKM